MTLEILVVLIISLAVVVLGMYVAHGVVHKYLDYKRAVYKDMDVLLHNTLDTVASIVDKLHPAPIEINEIVQGEVSLILQRLEDINKQLVDYDKLQEDLKEIQGRLAVNSVGTAFMPRRKS